MGSKMKRRELFLGAGAMVAAITAGKAAQAATLAQYAKEICEISAFGLSHSGFPRVYNL